MAAIRSTGKVRIIAGEWRGRTLSVAPLPGLRPTGDRVRETVFNWLAPALPGARVLDLFAGTGALSFEALSRGARFALMCETQARAVDGLRAQAAVFGANAEIRSTDARKMIAAKPPSAPFDIVFVDPPFADNDAPQLCTLLAENGWLAPSGLVYVERSSDGAQAMPDGFVRQREKKTGRIQFGLYRLATIAGES